MNKITVKNAYENNLKNISLDIPLNKIVSVIGVSGSGKSTLIYNVIANEAKRREKIDSGNASCLDFAIRAKFDDIINLPYVKTLKQRGISQSISSTIATFTSLHELLRDEFVKNGIIINEYGSIVNEPNVKDIKKFIEQYYKNKTFELFAVVCYKKYTDGVKEIALLKEFNIKEFIFWTCITKKESKKKISQLKKLNPNYQTTILVPIKLDEIEKYEKLAIDSFLLRANEREIYFYYDFIDLETGKLYQRKLPELFSFNSTLPYSGRCKKCDGKGKIQDIDWDNLIDNSKTIDEFLKLETNDKGNYKYIGISKDSLIKIIKKNKQNLDKFFYEFDEELQKELKNIIKQKILKHQGKPSIGKFVKTVVCGECNGTRLNYKANAVKLFGKSISEILALNVDELNEFLKDKTLHHKKIFDILKALKNATLSYLTLDRTTDTLSGGEIQRLKFAVELISEYKNLLYILDEPSTGLHPYNNYQMIELIKSLKEKGNSVIISEHNEEYIKNSDYIIELGPKGGIEGGKIIFQGKTKEFKPIKFRREKLKIDLKNSLVLENVNVNNIKNENFTIPLNTLVAITGISGSGKSSLIHKALVPSIKSYINIKAYDTNNVKNIKNIDKISDIIELSQSQIGNNSRSIVATYLNIFDDIRSIFASLDVSKKFGFDKSYFSFNSSSGACDECKGMGEIDEKICPSCMGNRYKPEVLEIKFNGLNIIELLNLTVEELVKIDFNNQKIESALKVLEKVGLSHLTLSRITPTLSGGEAQRLKLSLILNESQKKIKQGNLIFVFDEPTTGLNKKDISKLFDIFDEILKFNNSIIVIEHNQQIIRNSDFIIDIGPYSGNRGGKNIFSGTFDELLKNNKSLTAKAFKNEFETSEKINITQNLKEKKFHFDKSSYECHKFYLDDVHFIIEKEFAKNYEVLTDNSNCKYFKSKDEIFAFIKSLKVDKIAFNPYVSDLYRYKIVPNSIKKERVKNLKKIGFKIKLDDYKENEWSYRVYTNSLDIAYNFGKGWITIESNGTTYELFTRVVSIKNKIIGDSKIDEHTFNVYLNSCNYCNGKGYLYAYDKNLIIQKYDKTILDKDFFQFKLSLKLKTIIERFKKEGLFDFTKPFNKLDEEEKNIFLFGFKEYKFLKPKGRVNALSDYIKWDGLYRYIFENLDRIDIANKIRESKHKEKCPFCVNGFKNEVKMINHKKDNNRIYETIQIFGSKRLCSKDRKYEIHPRKARFS